MRSLPRFWTALDELPAAATDALDWRRRLGDEFELASRYLRRTGAVADAIDCPSPGGDGCPRAVVKLPSGALRAVCGSRSGRCDSVDVQRDDIAILALDRAILAADLAVAFSITPIAVKGTSARVLRLGGHAAAAGLAAPVVLALPGPRDQPSEQDFRQSGVALDRAVVLMPTASTLSPTTVARLADQKHLVLSLSETTAINSTGNLAAVQPIDVLLRPIRDALLDRAGLTSTAPSILVPPGTEWAKIKLTLTADATLVCKTPTYSRQIDPSSLGMRSAKNNAPTNAWVLLMALISEEGLLKIAIPSQRGRVQKQKQTLADRLQRAFGIASDPMPWDDRQNAYVAQFIVENELPVTAREPQRRR